MKRFLSIAVLLSIIGSLAGFQAAAQVQKDEAASAKAPLGYFHTYPARPVTPLDPKIQAALEAQAGRPSLLKLPVAQARAELEKRMAALPRLNEAVAQVDNKTVPGPYGDIPLRIYTPPGRGPFPMLLYIHGGGWVMGSVLAYDDLCRSFSHRSGAVVVAVDYRLAPDHKFPAPLKECYAALQWVGAHAGEIGGDGNRLAVAGDSAGGNLAAALAIYARDHRGPRLALQVLIYPATNYGFDTASYHENAGGYGITREGCIFFWNTYLASPADGSQAYASPLQAANLKGLPPALILTAQYDPLRDDGEAYAARLHRAGVSVRLTRYLDMNHGFINGASLFPQANRGIQEIADALRAAFTGSKQ